MTHMITARVVIAAGVGLATAVLALTPAGAVTPSSHARLTVTVKAGQAGITVSHHVIRPGRMHIRNGGPHPVIVLTAQHGSTITTLVDDNAAANSSGPTAAATTKLLRDFAIDTLLPARSDAYLPVPRGKLFLFDADRDTIAANNVVTITVTGASATAAAPHSASVAIVVGGSITRVTHTVPRSAYLQVTNSSHHLQTVLLASVNAAATAQDVNRFLQHPRNLAYLTTVLDFNKPIHNLTLLSPAHRIWTHYTVSAGRHLLISVDTQSTSTDFPFQPGHVRLLITT